jgi:putative ABC transport system ATP-binding protein
MIRMRDIAVVYNRGSPMETHALRGLDLEIPAGQFVTVIGSNGAGKSTLLNVLTGDAAIAAGVVGIDEQDITGWPPPKRAALVARVFQDPMAGSCAARRGLGAAVDRSRRKDFRDRLRMLGLGLENRMHDRMGLLSGGQRQAVSLLMATLRPMKILLLDEHTAALDPKTAEFVLRLTERIVAEQTLTTLMVTHSMRQALDHGDRTLMLHDGRIVFDVAGAERKGLDVPDLLALFARQRGESLSDDSLLLD